MSYIIRGAALCSLMVLPACSSGADVEAVRQAELAACGLDDGTVERDADLRACAPDKNKKTTICHVPPGNPANAHTLCIGNAAVSHHLKNHGGDYLGPCRNERSCSPPADAGGADAGTSAGGTGGVDGTGGTGGSDEMID